MRWPTRDHHARIFFGNRALDLFLSAQLIPTTAFVPIAKSDGSVILCGQVSQHDGNVGDCRVLRVLKSVRSPTEQSGLSVFRSRLVSL